MIRHSRHIGCRARGQECSFHDPYAAIRRRRPSSRASNRSGCAVRKLWYNFKCSALRQGSGLAAAKCQRPQMSLWPERNLIFSFRMPSAASTRLCACESSGTMVSSSKSTRAYGVLLQRSGVAHGCRVRLYSSTPCLTFHTIRRTFLREWYGG